MVVRPHLHWFRMLLAWRGSVLPQLLPRLFLIFGISMVALAVHAHWLPIRVNLSTTPAQRQKAVENLHRYEQDFRTLHAQKS